MTRFKVNRVSTPDEARELEALEVGMIGVSLVADLRFRDRRDVDLARAAEIARAVQRATVVAQLAPDADPVALAPGLRAAGIVRIEFAVHPPPPRATCDRLRDLGLAVAICRVVASHDDDPAWIWSGIEDAELGPIAHREVELLPEMEDAWRFLRDQSPDHEDELQIDDIERLAAADPVFISVGATRDTVREVIARLPSVAAVSFNLGTSNPDNAIAHASSLDVVRQALAARR